MPVALGFAALVAVGAAGEWFPRILRARFVVWLGVVSYGTYLWHQPVMCLLGGHGLLPRNLWIELPLVWPLTLLVAWASWRFVEGPVLRWAHRRGEGRRPVRRIEPAARGRDLARPAPALAAKQA
jgi:peptidoglycan/LPS O-acetylase OafA/YrhL